MRLTARSFSSKATKNKAAQGGQFDVGRAVLLDRHGAQDSLECEGSAVGQRVHAAGEVDRLWQGLQDQQLLDVARSTPSMFRPS